MKKIAKKTTRKDFVGKQARQRRVTPPRQKSCAREESTKDCAI